MAYEKLTNFLHKRSRKLCKAKDAVKLKKHVQVISRTQSNTFITHIG